jgi:hypothetical protein
MGLVPDLPCVVDFKFITKTTGMVFDLEKLEATKNARFATRDV